MEFKFFEKFLKALGRQLILAKIKKPPDLFVLDSVKTALFSGIVAWLAIGLYSGKIFQSLLFSIALAVAVFAVQLRLPKMRSKRIAALAERDLPFALLSMSTELNMGISFEKSLKNIARGGYGIVSMEFQNALDEILEFGVPVHEALIHSSESVDSISFKRAVSQIVNAYHRGGKNCGDSVKRIALEILSRQKSESKEFSGKLAVFSLLFIAVSAIVPAIFLALIAVGSFFLKIKFSPLQIMLIVAVGFPLLDLAVFFYIKSKTPVFLEA